MLRRRMLIMLGVSLVVVLLLAAYKAFAIYQQIQGFYQASTARQRGSGDRG
ncbi:hypothetical protein QF043_001600 [Pseudomonas sp. W3I7]|nr:hypothetical protein [Pseudomonas sp. W3I7]